jgi:hypothetical protein
MPPLDAQLLQSIPTAAPPTQSTVQTIPTVAARTQPSVQSIATPDPSSFLLPGKWRRGVAEAVVDEVEPDVPAEMDAEQARQARPG